MGSGNSGVNRAAESYELLKSKPFEQKLYNPMLVELFAIKGGALMT